ncbi:hypothetical protein DAI22_06g104000 [Oryza sativa Japonica Group]|nr:hypothetical protein DAI22_06g104000 [Oryza sativa Japonica Group]
MTAKEQLDECVPDTDDASVAVRVTMAAAAAVWRRHHHRTTWGAGSPSTARRSFVGNFL